MSYHYAKQESAFGRFFIIQCNLKQRENRESLWSVKLAFMDRRGCPGGDYFCKAVTSVTLNESGCSSMLLKLALITNF